MSTCWSSAGTGYNVALCLPDGPRPGKDEVMEIRKQMLHYVKCLILKGQGIHEDELQSILNYLTTVHEASSWARVSLPSHSPPPPILFQWQRMHVVWPSTIESPSFPRVTLLGVFGFCDVTSSDIVDRTTTCWTCWSCS